MQNDNTHVYSITLSRAHKLAERLKVHAGELSSTATLSASSVTVHGKTDDAQVEKLSARDAAATAALESCLAVTEVLGQVRKAIGRANVNFGVADLLSEQAAVTGQLAAVKSYLGQAQAQGIAPQQLATYQPIGKPEYGGSGVVVQASSPESIEKFEAKQQLLQARLYTLSDEVAAANARKIEISLPLALAKVVGLA